MRREPEGSEKKAESTDEAAAEPTKKANVEPEAEEPPVVETFQMPALVGANLQDAQDMLQSLGSYLLTQMDATGMERFQFLDSGRKVCGQRPRAGRSVPLEKMVSSWRSSFAPC